MSTYKCYRERERGELMELDPVSCILYLVSCILWQFDKVDDSTFFDMFVAVRFWLFSVPLINCFFPVVL